MQKEDKQATKINFMTWKPFDGKLIVFGFE